MPDYKYSFQGFDAEHMARCVGKDLPISTKHSIEICKFLKGKSLEKAKYLLVEISEKKQALKFTRFNKGVGHKPGIGPGRYPVKACKAIHHLLGSVEGNAVYKGMDGDNLIIKHIACHQASRPMKQSRRTRGESKRTHVEIVVEESVTKKPKEQDKKNKTENKKVKSETKSEDKK
ncbi:MAG: 50S ribosomal protein L22 [Nanoarchaeota archaeon]|nr:50S ribosomal protein L22 [Nanoarchaeota archaeon]